MPPHPRPNFSSTRLPLSLIQDGNRNHVRGEISMSIAFAPIATIVITKHTTPIICFIYGTLRDKDQKYRRPPRYFSSDMPFPENIFALLFHSSIQPILHSMSNGTDHIPDSINRWRYINVISSTNGDG
jgi:hypothetical protein